MRRLDLLRTRFLVLYMGLLAAGSVVPDRPVVEKSPERSTPKMALRPHLHHALTEGIVRKPPLRRLTTQAMGHSNTHIGGAQKMGWASVVNELQMSPLMHKRHASIDAAMANPP